MKVSESAWPLIGTALALVAVLAILAAASRESPGALPPPPVASAAPPFAKSYTTSFPVRERHLSEAGRWIGGKTVGLDWGDVSTTTGIAFGFAGPKPFADSVALLTGSWGPDQTVEEVVDKGFTSRTPEVEIRLRSTLSAHRCTGYEISNSLRDTDDAYLIIVRWNGPLGDFTYLLNTPGRQYGVKSGDVIKASIVGDTITAWKNGVQIGQARDDTWKTGQPGFGFNEGENGYYGISRVTASASGTAP